MRTSFVPALGAGFLFAVLSAGAATPEGEVRTAFSSLIRAGNYTWDASRAVATDKQASSRPLPNGTGETQVGGFTVAMMRKCAVVFLNNQAAIKPYDEWRHARDVSDVELRSYGIHAAGSVGSPRRSVGRSWPHEELEHVLRLARNFRKDGAAIAADLAATDDEFMKLERYFLHGGSTENPIGLLGTVSDVLRPGVRRPMRPGSSAVLVVWLRGAEIEEFRVELTRSLPTVGTAPGEGTSAIHTTYIRKVRDIGRTKVVVDPIAEALRR